MTAELNSPERRAQGRLPARAVWLLVAILTVVTCSQKPPSDELDRASRGPSSISAYGRLTSPQWAFGAKYTRRDLDPVVNSNPNPEAQPHRDHPFGLAIIPNGSKVYVTLSGNEAAPSHEVAVFDVKQRKVVKRIGVGRRPRFVGVHPGGRYLVVLNELSNYASVIDSTKDEVTSEIPLDFYATHIAFNDAGTTAYVSVRYLDQVLIVDLRVEDSQLRGGVRRIGGFDSAPFLDKKGSSDDLHQVLVESCGGANCHARAKGGFYAGKDARKTFLSAVESSVPGDPDESILLRAILSTAEAGFADDRAGANFHAGGLVVWSRSDERYKKVAKWIRAARYGPGIPIGNFGSKPGTLALSADGKRLYVGNRGTLDISIVDLEKNEEITAIYTQTINTGLGLYRNEEGTRELLIALSMGLGFGAARERDPYGGETTDPENPAAQFTVQRNPETTEPFPIEKQSILGPFDATDGTAAFKMSDIQNDVLVVDTKRIVVPKPRGVNQLDYALLANRYEAHDGWVRYTSDSAEILPHDLSGDIPPELQRVVGAYPFSIAVSGRRAFVVMLGTYELVEWKIHPDATEASEVLEPVAVYPTGIMPRDVVVGPSGTVAEGLVFVSNFLSETISVIDTNSSKTRQFVVGDLTRPFPDSNAERGEMFVDTCVFSVDQDTACASCHINSTSDGRGWGAGQAIGQMRDGKFVNGGQLGIPQLRNLFATQPFYFEGTHTAFDAQLDDIREHMALHGFLAPNPHGDFTQIHHPLPESERKDEHEELQDKMSTDRWGPSKYHDLKERRDELTRQITARYFGKAFNFRDLQRFVGDYQAAEPRLLPNPTDQHNPSVLRGKLLFGDLGVGCVSCHKPPNFTDKSEALSHNRNRTLPALISFTKREQAFTLVGPSWMDTINGYQRDVESWEKGRVERNEGHMTTFPLRGLFDRPFTFLHHGRALSVRETIATPDHYSLRKFKYSPLRGSEEMRPSGRERGFNELSFFDERTYMMDTHGATSHLNARQIQDLENFLLSID